MKYKQSWYIHPDCHEEIKCIFSSIDQVLSLSSGEIISSSSISRVIKFSFNHKNFYIKHYFSKGKKLRRIFGRSRCRAEWENLIFCDKLNIQVPKLIAYGEKRSFFGCKFEDGIIITEEVQNAVDLKKIALYYPDILKQKSWRHEIIKIVAHYVALLHKNKFLHYDLQWRNILVNKSLNLPKVYLFDMPSGKIRKYFFTYFIKRDFYNLYKSAVLFLSRTDQLRFYLLYKSARALTKRDKIEIRRYINYYIKKETFEISVK